MIPHHSHGYCPYVPVQILAPCANINQWLATIRTAQGLCVFASLPMTGRVHGCAAAAAGASMVCGASWQLSATTQRAMQSVA